MKAKRDTIVAEVVGGEVVPDASGGYANSEHLYVTIRVPLSRAKDFPMGFFVRVTVPALEAIGG